MRGVINGNTVIHIVVLVKYVGDMKYLIVIASHLGHIHGGKCLTRVTSNFIVNKDLMKNLLFIIGIILFLGGICLGLYVGFWIMFIGGLVDIINAVKSVETSAGAVGWGALKILLSGVAGWLTFAFSTIVSALFFAAAD